MIFAGHRELQFRGTGDGPPLSALLHYPTEQPSRPTRFGPYELDVSVEAPPAPGRFPLVLISHGSGGSPLLHRTISLRLARHGYFVALPRHAGNTLGDNELAETVANFRNRPAQLAAVLDALLGEAATAASIAAQPVIAIGHSMGGYTVLCLAGGQPWMRSGEPLRVAHDARIGSLVLMAPACGPFLAPGALGSVTAPTLALTAERDSLTPDGEIRAALAGVADPATLFIQKVPNAGHLSFLSPFPRAMHSPQFEPALDPSGFDRERFHEWLPTLILEWIRERGSIGGTRAYR